MKSMILYVSQIKSKHVEYCKCLVKVGLHVLDQSFHIISLYRKFLVHMKYDFTLLTPLSFQKADSHICLYAKYDLFQVFVSEASPHLPPVSQSPNLVKILSGHLLNGWMD